MGQMKIPTLTVQNHWAVEDGHYVFDDPSSVPYTHIEILGKGQRGVVDKVKDTRTNLVYARKTYKVSPRSRRQREIDRQEYRREIEITRRLAQHRHVVHIVASYSTEDTLAVILEPVANGGDLKTFLAQYAAVECPGQKALMLKTIHRAYGCLTSGLAFMHARRIRHRDIKPENILIHSNSVMYTDFGVSRDYSDRADSATEHYPGPYTAKYCAPEVQDQAKRTSKTDIFSLGVVFLLLYTAVWPSEVLEIIAKYRFYDYLENIRGELDEWMEDKDKDHEVVVCLRGMLMEEEKQRLSANEILDVLMRDKTKYMCEGCQEETSMLTRAEDLTSLGGGGGVVKTHTTISTHVETKSSISHQSKLQEQITPPPANNLQRPQTPLASSQELVSCQSTSQSLHSRHDSVIGGADLDTRSPHSNPALSPSSFTVQSTHLETTRSWYGIYQHKMVRTLRTSSNTSSPTNAINGTEKKECVLYEDRIYDWEMKRLGFGIRLSKRTPFGSILPSLHMFPIVPYFSYEIDLIFDGTLFEVQQALATGKLHPYVQNEAGETLLHLAVRANRLDIGTLLHQCGVPATPTHTGRSLFLCATQNCQFFPVDRVISCLRFLLSTCDHQPDFTNPTWIRAQKTFFWDTEVTHWLFTSGIEYGLDREAVEELCLRVTLRTVGIDPSLQMEKLEEPEALMRRYMITESDVRMQMEQADRAERVESLIRRYMTPNLVSRIKRSEMCLVADLFDREYYAPPLPFSPTFVLGALWLKVLSSYSIDLVTYLLHELDAHPNGLIHRRSYDLKIIAGLTEGGQFVLGWRIAMEHTPGFPLVSEFNDLGVEMEIGEWPYAEWGEGGFDVVRDAEEKRMVRFQRRVDRKARKERMEKGVSNAGMVPGSWIE